MSSRSISNFAKFTVGSFAYFPFFFLHLMRMQQTQHLGQLLPDFPNPLSLKMRQIFTVYLSNPAVSLIYKGLV